MNNPARPEGGQEAASSPYLTELARSLACVNPFPQVVLRVRQAAADQRNGVGAIGRLVEGDVGISANLLRVANAPVCGLRQRCSSVRQAVTLLGIERVCEVVTSAAALALLETAQRGVANGALRVGHAIAVAGVARLLAPITNTSPDAAFTAGLLHDFGSLLLQQSEDPFCKGLVEQYGNDEEPSPADERALLGFDHAALGAEVLRQWNLPAPLPQIVALHHDWEQAAEVGGSVSTMVALVRVADLLVDELARTAEPRLEPLSRLVTDPAFAYIGLNGEELLKLWAGLRRACNKSECLGDETASPPSVGAQAPLPVALPARQRVEDNVPTRAFWVGALVLSVAAAGLVLLVLH